MSLNLKEYTSKDPKVIFDITDYFHKANPTYNTAHCDTTGHIAETSNKPFSSAVNLKNGRVLLTPFNENKIKLFNMTDGTVAFRTLPNEQNRFIDSHLLHNSTVVMIPADSNKNVLLYDIASAKFELKSPCQVNGDKVFEDIFSNSVILNNGEIFCSNKKWNKPFVYNPYTDTWRAVQSNENVNTPNEGGGCLLGDGTVFLTGRMLIETKEPIFQIYNPKTNTTKTVKFKMEIDEFIGCIPDKDLYVWLIPYKGRRIVKLNTADMTYIEYFLPENIASEDGISKGGCYSANGNLFISAYGITNAFEFNPNIGTYKICEHTPKANPAKTSGALMMTNGLIFTPPADRKSGIVYGTEIKNASVDVFINPYFNTSR